MRFVGEVSRCRTTARTPPRCRCGAGPWGRDAHGLVDHRVVAGLLRRGVPGADETGQRSFAVAVQRGSSQFFEQAGKRGSEGVQRDLVP